MLVIVYVVRFYWKPKNSMKSQHAGLSEGQQGALQAPEGLLHLLPSTTDRWWLPYNHTLPIRLKLFVVNLYFHKTLCKQHSFASFGQPRGVAKVTHTDESGVVKCEEPHEGTGLALLNSFG